MIEIVKIGYEKLTFEKMYNVIFENYSSFALPIVLGEKEKLKKKVKPEFEYYYLKDSLLKEPINLNDILFNEDYEENSIFKVVPIPQKELETILLKNQMCGYITSENIVQEKEFDTLFDTFYPKLVEMVLTNFSL